jgi:hypothetical protein
MRTHGSASASNIHWVLYQGSRDRDRIGRRIESDGSDRLANLATKSPVVTGIGSTTGGLRLREFTYAGKPKEGARSGCLQGVMPRLSPLVRDPEPTSVTSNRAIIWRGYASPAIPTRPTTRLQGALNATHGRAAKRQTDQILGNRVPLLYSASHARLLLQCARGVGLCPPCAMPNEIDATREALRCAAHLQLY